VFCHRNIKFKLHVCAAFLLRLSQFTSIALLYLQNYCKALFIAYNIPENVIDFRDAHAVGEF
jgi:hypothetical protein